MFNVYSQVSTCYPGLIKTSTLTTINKHKIEPIALARNEMLKLLNWYPVAPSKRIYLDLARQSWHLTKQ